MSKTQIIQNKKYWNEFGINYVNNWRGPAKEALSQRELSFINKYLLKSRANRILDIGIGTGRILDNYLKNINHSKDSIFGIDLAEEMVATCKNKYKDVQPIKLLKACDIANDPTCIDGKFDYISAIRVLKYNDNWHDMLKNILGKLDSNGILVFSMPNKNSLSRLANYGTPIHLTNKKELMDLINNSEYEILEISSFSKLPHFLYSWFNIPVFAQLLILAEKFFELMAGNIFLGKIFFVAAKRRK